MLALLGKGRPPLSGRGRAAGEEASSAKPAPKPSRGPGTTHTLPPTAHPQSSVLQLMTTNGIIPEESFSFPAQLFKNESRQFILNLKFVLPSKLQEV